jgi:Raf kinase inhibitor-like YbhB/YbcL family protein
VGRPWRPAVLAPVVALSLVLVGACGGGSGSGAGAGSSGSGSGGSGGSGGSAGSGSSGDPDVAVPLTVTLASPAFRDGDVIPVRYSCEGDNVPPPLVWRGMPPGTAELVVAVTDPDAPQGPFYHWVLLGLPATQTQLADGAPAPAGTRQATATSGQPEYVGMCPPDRQRHHYHFTVYALRHRETLPAGVPAAAAVAAVRQDALARGTLVGLFGR